MSIVQKLTEGIVNRDLGKEGTALIGKWEQTGLLEGLGSDDLRNGMARLLENQARELLRESSSMAAGDVEGFAAVAFPLVRRVFGSLIANDLVSVQPMSLPSGLIFFLDFTVSNEIADGQTADTFRLGYPRGSSLYGGGRVGSQITGGVLLTGQNAERGPYALNNGYSSPTGSAGVGPSPAALEQIASGSIGVGGLCDFSVPPGNQTAAAYQLRGLLEFDPDLASGSSFSVVSVLKTDLADSAGGAWNQEDAVAIKVRTAAGVEPTNGIQARRLQREDPTDSARVLLVLVGGDTGTVTVAQLDAEWASGLTASFPIVDNFGGTSPSIGAVLPAQQWGLEGNAYIPEIDIKVDSVAVTAITKKLKAKWTPELGQDLNAYHNLDAEVELTQILSEQVALEIDQEILEDLVVGATAGVRYWSRSPGDFLNRETGVVIGTGTAPPDFTGNVSEWYETLIETINDVSAQIHRKTLRGAANFVVCGPEVANILEFTAGFRANVTADSDRGDAGAVKVGSLSKKFDVIVDPYFPRNLVLVGRRGSSFLESGYVYAPYVPLQTTPTIFGVEDFVPRKGVMTRYAKKMVRPDMYGLVVIKSLV
tara:strand:- start:17580 stop:19361 length:1782 start_codon:yes stop_codon:yes gene_type:complete